MQVQKQNYQKILDSTLESIANGKIKGCHSEKPSLLLHACCAPCSSYVIEYLSEFFYITVLYYNPNIYPQEEYERRLLELKSFLLNFPLALKNKINLVVLPYNQNEFYDAIKIKENSELANEKERGERCQRCYYFRMKKALEYAAQNNFDFFTTTLSISPFKDAQKINEIGKELVLNNASVKFLIADFKKRNGFKRSLELSKEYNLYRQEYCGCVYSMQNMSTSKNELIS